ncbi:NAD(P)H-binding protein [Corynebacterium renale]|uniref:NAD(P)H-binding protein n=1 Tax=Corynebacterium renale TaxID=1724 RepID=UPI000E015A0F|nr:NAD(P)H-binding protein [Corynebacterium renale]STC96024.1 nucleoside-diphosphate-sugar epimerase [Corynebacterium renale]
MTTAKKVLIIGGHGKDARLLTPLLIDAGHNVTSVIRQEDQVGHVQELGAQPLVQDITALNAVKWNELLAAYDVIVWSAGAGGRGDATTTRAVDRDAAWSMIDSLNRLDDRPEKAPTLLLVSFTGSLNNPWDKNDPMYAYGLAKQEVDRRLNAGVKFPFVVVAPGELTDDDNSGIKRVDDIASAAEPTPRQAVAAVLAELVGRADIPEHGARVAIAGGGAPASEISF